MRFLRMLTNALLAGALGAAYLTILLLQLNPQVPLASPSVWGPTESCTPRMSRNRCSSRSSGVCRAKGC